mmetsp:Transcript_9276/g.37973  ORF Transcript_9276/g.37973 Transcript_9276/m.37973 type:complete len:302 (-) Transcript_9276:1062-1967(-)
MSDRRLPPLIIASMTAGGRVSPMNLAILGDVPKMYPPATQNVALAFTIPTKSSFTMTLQDALTSSDMRCTSTAVSVRSKNAMSFASISPNSLACIETIMLLITRCDTCTDSRRITPMPTSWAIAIPNGRNGGTPPALVVPPAMTSNSCPIMAGAVACAKKLPIEKQATSPSDHLYSQTSTISASNGDAVSSSGTLGTASTALFATPLGILPALLVSLDPSMRSSSPSMPSWPFSLAKMCAKALSTSQSVSPASTWETSCSRSTNSLVHSATAPSAPAAVTAAAAALSSEPTGDPAVCCSSS